MAWGTHGLGARLNTNAELWKGLDICENPVNKSWILAKCSLYKSTFGVLEVFKVVDVCSDQLLDCNRSNLVNLSQYERRIIPDFCSETS